jgi:ATP-dependent DNA ligase
MGAAVSDHPNVWPAATSDSGRRDRASPRRLSQRIVSARNWGLPNRVSSSPAKVPPSGPGWLHEIKHDGFRILARRDSAGIRLITPSGKPFLVALNPMAVGKLPVRARAIEGDGDRLRREEWSCPISS